MRLVLQRVSSAAVRVDGEEIAAIGRGVVVFVGVEKGDGPEQVARAADRLAALRLFEDDQGKMNLDAGAVGGAFLIVSQFTLAASLDRGRRPSFDGAAEPGPARQLYRVLAGSLAERGFEVATGRFGARMAVELVNDGPVTFVLDL